MGNVIDLEEARKKRRGAHFVPCSDYADRVWSRLSYELGDFNQIGPPLPGDGPIEGVTYFHGRVFATRGGRLYCYHTDTNTWREIQV